MTRAVRAQVTRDEALRLRQVRVTNPAAEEAYLQGRLHLAGYGRKPRTVPSKSFQRAIDADPGYAAAHASAAFAYVKLASFAGVSHAEARLLARAEIRKAFETGDDIAEAHAAEADLRFLYDWDWEGAERELQRSLDLNPSFMYARNVYAQLLAAQKRFDEMLSLSEESLQMDPQSLDALVNHGMLLYYKRDYAAAEEVCRRALSMQPGDRVRLAPLDPCRRSARAVRRGARDRERGGEARRGCRRQSPRRRDSPAGALGTRRRGARSRGGAREGRKRRHHAGARAGSARTCTPRWDERRTRSTSSSAPSTSATPQ